MSLQNLKVWSFPRLTCRRSMVFFWAGIVFGNSLRSQYIGEKFVYLQQAVKNKTAKQIIEGLSNSSEYYKDAVQFRKDRYNQPCLIHQAHVRMIVEAPALKEGLGCEIHKLHDNIQQHLCALTSWRGIIWILLHFSCRAQVWHPNYGCETATHPGLH